MGVRKIDFADGRWLGLDEDRVQSRPSCTIAMLAPRVLLSELVMGPVNFATR
jgi:hypothetical protein